MATTAGAPPGSGANFRALKAKLAARGNVTDPGRLAAWIGRKKYGRKGMAKLSAAGRSHSHANGAGMSIIDLDWATWDAEHGSTAGARAHATASATAKATARRHMASKRERADAGSAVRGFKAKSASQLKPGHMVVHGHQGQLEEHRVIGVQRKPNGHIRLHTLGPDGKHHYQNMPANTQVSYRGAPGETAMPQVLKAGGFAGLTPAGNPYGLSNGAGMRYDLAAGGDQDNLGNDSRMTCPSCGHTGPASSFGSGGASLDKAPGELRTPAPSTGGVRSGAATAVSRGSVGAPGLANRGQRDVRLSAALRPVTGPDDVIVARDADTGQAVIRHRSGGHEVARMRRDDQGWVASVGGRDLPATTHQRTALMNAVGTYNRTVTTPFRPGMPLQGPPEQTSLMRQYGIPAIRLAGDGDGADDDGLTPRGQAIKKKLLAKGFPAARAVAFARRAQNTRPGQFGQGGS